MMFAVSAKKERVRELLHASPFQPFVIRMADGRAYRIGHPDVVLAAATDVPQITIKDAELSAMLITGIERVGAASADAQNKG